MNPSGGTGALFAFQGSILARYWLDTARCQARRWLDARLDVDPRSSTQQSMVTGSMGLDVPRRQSSIQPRRHLDEARFLDARAQLSGAAALGKSARVDELDRRIAITATSAWSSLMLLSFCTVRAIGACRAPLALASCVTRWVRRGLLSWIESMV